MLCVVVLETDIKHSKPKQCVESSLTTPEVFLVVESSVQIPE